MAETAAIWGRNELNFSWLMKLRWSSVVGQLATILGVYFVLEIRVPLAPLLGLVGLGAASNIGCALWFNRRPVVHEWHLAAIMALDIALLTALLYFTGGPQNPFSFLYLVNIALAAVVIHAQLTWMLVALSLVSFGILPLVDYWSIPLGDLSAEDMATARQQGMWVAFGVAAGFIVHFLWRVTGALAQRDAELSEARNQSARQEQLASLATMAAGAAHELATPLGTIALVAGELERALAEASAETIEDVRLIREQVGRCRLILDQMAIGAGKSAEDSLTSVSVEALLAEAMTGLREQPPVQLDLPREVAERRVEVPPQALAQAVRSLLTNAQDASDARASVALRGRAGRAELEIEVEDFGAGMDNEVLARVGEPFFTTKEPGQGMGLGLFLTRAVVEGLGGRLAMESASGTGTRVRVTIPVNPLARPAHPNEGEIDAAPTIHSHR